MADLADETDGVSVGGSAFNSRLGANIKKARDSEYDAYYNLETLEWVDPICDDKTCEFCKNRPPKFEPPN